MNTWFVVKFLVGSNEGTVLWDYEFPTIAEAATVAQQLQAGDPAHEYEASDLPDLMTVYVKVAATFVPGNTTLH